MRTFCLSFMLYFIFAIKNINISSFPLHIAYFHLFSIRGLNSKAITNFRAENNFILKNYVNYKNHKQTNRYQRYRRARSHLYTDSQLYVYLMNFHGFKGIRAQYSSFIYEFNNCIIGIFPVCY